MAVQGEDDDERRRSARSRRWCFTLQSIPESFELGRFLQDEASIKFCCGQQEVCPTTGRRHFQGYICFKNPRTFEGCRRFFGGNTHLEPAHGTEEQCVAYCSKEATRIPGTYVEIGERGPGQGKRNDLLSIKELIDADAPETELWEQHFSSMVRNHRGIERYRSTRAPDRERKTEFVVIFGEPGCGKSYKARELIRERGFNCFALNTFEKDIWFDGFRSGDAVLVDDYRGGLSPSLLLSLTDEGPLSVKYKGGMHKFNAPLLVLTSNINPENWHPNVDYFHQALFRRFDKVLFTEEFKVFHDITDRYLSYRRN